MATTNRLVTDYHWTPANIKSLKHFAAIVQGWALDPKPTDAEIREAYEFIKPSKK